MTAILNGDHSRRHRLLRDRSTAASTATVGCVISTRLQLRNLPHGAQAVAGKPQATDPVRRRAIALTMPSGHIYVSIWYSIGVAREDVFVHDLCIVVCQQLFTHRGADFGAEDVLVWHAQLLQCLQRCFYPGAVGAHAKCHHLMEQSFPHWSTQCHVLVLA